MGFRKGKGKRESGKMTLKGKRKLERGIGKEIWKREIGTVYIQYIEPEAKRGF